MHVVTPRPLHVPFTKMHGAGNDFIVIDNRFFNFSRLELATLARRYCPRHTGVGADGLLALDHSENGETAYRMRYHNADGSLAGMCGNGARCLARFARSSGLHEEPLVFDAEAGRYSAFVPAAGAEDFDLPDVRLMVPPPRDFDSAIRLSSGNDVAYIYTGTHHVVIFVDDLDAVNVEAEAPTIRGAGIFPEGVNVNYVQLLSGDHLAIRTFEKGVEAETLACGTGALAAATIAYLSGRSVSRKYVLDARGGRLEVGFETSGDEIRHLYLSGPAQVAFTGMLVVDPRAL